ncbi:MAG TPA: hypothetical protein VF219_17770, partial [Vicinamibacterales bacterium]
FHLKSAEPTRLTLAWEKSGAFARLDVDLAKMHAEVVASSVDEAGTAGLVWCSTPAAIGVMP